MDTGIAHDFAAMRALVRYPGSRVAWTKQAAVGQHNRGGGANRRLDFGNGNPDIGGLHEQFDLPQGQDFARMQLSFGYRFSINESAVGRITIPDSDFTRAENKLTMGRGNGSVLDLKIVLRAAPQTIQAKMELDHLVAKAFRFYHQPGHRVCN